MGGPGSGRRPAPEHVSKETREAYNESKVVKLFAHPRLDTVPDPDFILKGPGREKYRELAEMLLKSGQLTTITKGFAEMAAVAHDEIILRQKQERSISANLISRYERALANIAALDVDKKTQEGADPKRNRFRFSGFANRRR